MLDKMFEMPVPCSRCNEIIELNDCNFIDPNDNEYGVCDHCAEVITRGLDELPSAANQRDKGEDNVG